MIIDYTAVGSGPAQVLSGVAYSVYMNFGECSYWSSNEGKGVFIWLFSSNVFRYHHELHL